MSAGEAEEVDRADRPRPRRDRRLDPAGVDDVRVGLDVDEHRRRAGVQDRAGRRVERVADRDDLVAGLEAEPGEDRTSGRACRCSSAIAWRDAEELGPALLELGDPATLREHAAREDLGDGRDLLRRRCPGGRSGSCWAPSVTAGPGCSSRRLVVRHEGVLALARRADSRDRSRSVAVAGRRADGVGSRWPQAQTQPIRRAGLPATSAWRRDGSRVTTAPAPTIANGPTSQPATTTAPAPIEAAVREVDRADRPVVGPGQVAGRGHGARVPVVGEDRARADEDAVADRHAVIDERTVLDLDPVAERRRPRR